MTILQGLFTAATILVTILMVGVITSLTRHIDHYGLQSTMHDHNSLMLIAVLVVLLVAPLPFTVFAMVRRNRLKDQHPGAVA